jgi:fructokinase
MAKNGDPLANSTVEKYQDLLTQFLVNLVNLYDPDYFVLGGGVSLQDQIYEGLERRISERTFIPENYTPVYKHIIGDSAGVLGAAFLAL